MLRLLKKDFHVRQCNPVQDGASLCIHEGLLYTKNRIRIFVQIEN